MLLLFLFYIALFIATVTKSLAIGWLLVTSATLGGYCLVTVYFNKRQLTNLGSWILVFSIIGLIYSLMIIFGFDAKGLF